MERERVKKERIKKDEVVIIPLTEGGGLLGVVVVVVAVVVLEAGSGLGCLDAGPLFLLLVEKRQGMLCSTQ